MNAKKEEKLKQRYMKKSRGRAYAVLHAILGYPIRWIFRLHVHGAENEPKRGEGAYLLVCNHLTVLDPVWLCAVLKNQQPHFMAKAELFKVPVLSQLVRALGAYPIKRGGADVGAIRNTIKMLGEGRTVGMFPQGTRRKGVDPTTTEVRSGAGMIALKSGAPVLPVYIKTKDNRPRIFRRIDIYIGKPISTEQIESDGAPITEYAKASKFLFDRVCELGISKENV